jgi:hypothetical protein
MTKQKISFLSVAGFKKAIGASRLDIVHNEKSNKLSVLADEDSFYRCQQDIDPQGHMAFLVPDGDLSSACLVNTSTEGSPLTIKATI